MALFLLVVQDKYDGDSFGEFIFEEYNEESTEETSTIESSKKQIIMLIHGKLIRIHVIVLYQK